MADTTSLTNFLNDVASAIKEKTGDNTAIPASQFDTKIRSIPTGGTYETVTRTIQDNGNITLLPSQGYDAIDRVDLTINVPGGGDVKKFISKAAMDASSGNEEGDLAIVYGSSISNWTESTQSSTMIFGNTVILSDAFSGNVYSSFRAVDSSQMFYGNVQLSSSQFRFMIYTSSGSNTITYTSSDGITYTRTDAGEELLDIGFDVYCEYDWNDVLGNFIQTGGKNFEGLYEYKNVPGDILTVGIKLDDKLSGNNSYIYGMKSDLQSKSTADSTIGYPIFVKYEYVNDYKDHSIYTIVKAYNARNYYSNNSGLCLAYKDNKYYIAFYTTESTFQLYKYENGTNTLTTLPKNATTGLYSGDITLIEEINPAEWCIGSTAYYYDMSYGGYSLLKYTSSGYDNLYVSATNTPTYDHYTYAQTQFNLNNSSQLLTGVTGYGKNGVITGDGSIYNNLDKDTVMTNIFNLDYIEANGRDHFYAGLPTRYCCDNKEAGKIKFYKSLTVDTPAVHWVGSVDIPQTYIYTPRSGYNFQQLLKNEKHKLVISILYPPSGNWICQIEDAVTHTILHTEPFSVTDYVKAGMGEDFVYLFFVSSSTAYVDKINLSTYTKTRVESFNFAVANQRSVDVRTNGPYVSYIYYGRNDKVSKCHVSLIDEVTNRVITVRDTETLTTTSTSHEYKLALVNNPTYLYIGSSMGAVGTRSYKLHRIAKADDTVTLLGTGSVNGAYISDFSDANVYEDNNYIYTKNVAVSKNESSLSSRNYISTGTSLVDMNGDPITTYGTGLYPLGIKYINSKMYAVFRPFICEIDSFVTTINDGYMSFVYTCKNFFPFVNEGLIYSLIPNANMPNNAQLVYSQLDMSTFIALDNKTYKFNFNNTHTNTNELEGTIIFTPCVISDSLDYDYGCIYNQHNGPAGNIKNDNFIFANFNANHPLVNYDDIGTISPAETT